MTKLEYPDPLAGPTPDGNGPKVEEPKAIVCPDDGTEMRYSITYDTWVCPKCERIVKSFKEVRRAWHEVFTEKIENLIGFGRNWDGRGSAAVRGDAAFFAYSMLQNSMAPATQPPTIAPLGHGGILLIWSNTRADLEVDVVQPNEVVVYHLDHATGVETEWPATTEFSKLARLLRSGLCPQGMSAACDI